MTLHPVLVHFPVALLTLGAGADVAGLVLRSPELTRAGWYAMVAGAPLAIVAAVSGLAAALDMGYVRPEIEDVVNLHGTLIAPSIALIALLFVIRYPWRPGLPPHFKLYLAALFIAIGLLVGGAYFGGELVYTHGLGVGGRVER